MPRADPAVAVLLQGVAPMNARFVRLAEKERASVAFTIDGRPAQALAGDTLLVALLNTTDHVHRSAFESGARAGFCLMGACQDCWVWTEEGEHLRACTTSVSPGLRILTGPASWP
jgi:D-hydroxyproline dehydrogenase subunit gamma